jgi:hypothetical protein
VVPPLQPPARQVVRVEGRCLVEHAPSPQLCALRGGAWDDTEAAGGRCLGAARAAAVAAQAGVEEVDIDVAHDASEGRCRGGVWGGMAGFGLDLFTARFLRCCGAACLPASPRPPTRPPAPSLVDRPRPAAQPAAAALPAPRRPCNMGFDAGLLPCQLRGVGGRGSGSGGGGGGSGGGRLLRQGRWSRGTRCRGRRHIAIHRACSIARSVACLALELGNRRFEPPFPFGPSAMWLHTRRVLQVPPPPHRRACRSPDGCGLWIAQAALA